jgi:hypothetical protein
VESDLSAADSSTDWSELTRLIVHRAFDEGQQPQAAELVGVLLQRFLLAEPNFQALTGYFQYWEQYGIHVTPVSFYWPVPDTRQFPPEVWSRLAESEMRGIDMNDAVQLRLLRQEFPRFRSEYDDFPRQPTANEQDFYFENGMFGGADALTLYCMIRHFRPQLILEVGSGFSTLIASRAARMNGHTRLLAIDPYPRPFLAGLPQLEKVIPSQVQKVGLDVFQQLTENDILFIDSSHIVQLGGDVNYLFLEVLPRLQPGVLVHVHDIFLPGEYQPEMFMATEQYLLQAFLAFNTEFEVLFGGAYMERRHLAEVKAAFPNSPSWAGGSFWMRRKPPPR